MKLSWPLTLSLSQSCFIGNIRILEHWLQIDKDKRKSKLFFAIWSYSLVIVFWKFAEFQYKFDLPQVKRNLTSSRKDSVCELPQESLNNSKFKYLENLKVLENLKTEREGNFLLSSIPCRDNLLAFKYYAKPYTYVKVFCSSLILLIY